MEILNAKITSTSITMADTDVFNQAAEDMDKARQVGHGCDTCKYNRKIITEEPCSSCYIHLGNNRWQPNDSDGGDHE